MIYAKRVLTGVIIWTWGRLKLLCTCIRAFAALCDFLVQVIAFCITALVAIVSRSPSSDLTFIAYPHDVYLLAPTEKNILLPYYLIYELRMRQFMKDTYDIHYLTRAICTFTERHNF